MRKMPLNKGLLLKIGEVWHDSTKNQLFHGLINKMILATFAGDTTIVDGVDRTVVVTGKTTSALAVMEPYGGRTLDIIDRTDLRTLATLDTDIGIDHKLLVSNHPLVEIAADDIGIESWGGSLLQRHHTLPTVLNGSDDF